jgi:hypothetical protein
MADTEPEIARSSLRARLTASVAERVPFALPIVRRALDRLPSSPEATPQAIDTFARAFQSTLAAELTTIDATDVPETTPGVTAEVRLDAARRELLDLCFGFFAREAIVASLTREERLEILRGMVLTRALDTCGCRRPTWPMRICTSGPAIFPTIGMTCTPRWRSPAGAISCDR